ncbi:MAG TPA: alpha/beta hydrolase [Rhodopila sp.]|uniref:alpha/beta fold hydrolase n=1 Tax=Rhodopila sp. TaxID=2480087 RepID=UPI002B54D21A|nr:alpha/beta hydrolase [Rhodopila sp.]HVY15839.1 alpha/beta hydrolase [Rhodopila sp.]
MDPLIRRISAWDGLPLHVRVWDGDPSLPPLLCLPGLVRTGGDFEAVVPAIARGRRAVTLDYVGRGDSGWTRDVARCSPEACLRDVMDVCAALHIHRAVAIGTSFGGLLAMGLAAASPSLLRAAVLNDIGPGIGTEGASFVRDFVGFDPALDSLEACVTMLRARLPPLSLDSDADWRRMAELTYRRGDDGRYHPLWDIRLADTLDAASRNLWPLWGALAHVPVLLVRGGVSNILLPDTVERMRSERPDMRLVTLPDIGHAPILTEAPALAAVQSFLEATA